MNTLTDAELINRIADLMEQGSQGRRQITGQYFEIDGRGVCAMGACLTAVGVKPQPCDNINLKEALEIKEWPKVMYPSETFYWTWIHNVRDPVYLDDAIVSLNDAGGWDFAHIIQWLRDVASGMTTAESR